ncbi:MAG: hypothetical protein IKQ94_10500 [Bacteroidales bacterium]|nr:hypothetical protein [Bacteroidales bacterium]
MMKRIIISLVLFFVFTIPFVGCAQYNDGVKNDPSREQFVRQLGSMYETNIIDFFPDDCFNLSSENEWGSYYSSSWESGFRCCAYYSKKVSTATMDSLEALNYIDRLKYDETTFTIDVPYMRHVESYRNTMKDTLQIPIANMRYAYFKLGKYKDTLIIDNKQYIDNREILPEDLIVYVLEAHNGNFWKNKKKALEEQRPVLSDHWKHGYAKGIAVSRNVSRVCWWAMAW